jgi:hypothetical protein
VVAVEALFVFAFQEDRRFFLLAGGPVVADPADTGLSFAVSGTESGLFLVMIASTRDKGMASLRQ